MITRSNLAEQLREYQLRSKSDWASVSSPSSSSSSSSSGFGSSRVDVVIFVIRELVILACLVFSAVSLYFPAHANHLHLDLHYHALALMHEGDEAHKTSLEKEVEDAPSLVYVGCRVRLPTCLLSLFPLYGFRSP